MFVVALLCAWSLGEVSVEGQVHGGLLYLLACFCVSFFFSFCLFAISLGRSCSIWRFPGQGSNQSCSHWPMPEPQKRGIRAASATYTTAHGNAGSLTH